MLPAIRTAVRTGDTPAAERQRMVKHPPHILVTTPESLFILLTADRSRQALRSVRTVIVDEIHAMADDKRGAHLALSLARLDDLVEKAGGPSPSADRLVCDGQADRDGRAVPRARRRRQRRDRQSRPPPRDGSGGRSAAGRAWAGRIERDVAGDLRPHRRADQRAQDDAGVRQHPAAGRARRPQSGRAAGRRRGAGASRQPVAQAAADRGREAEDRKAQGGGGDGIARARHRHRHGRSRLPDRLSAIDRRCAAAHRPLRPSGRAHDQAQRARVRDHAR